MCVRVRVYVYVYVCVSQSLSSESVPSVSDADEALLRTFANVSRLNTELSIGSIHGVEAQARDIAIPS